MWCVLLMSLTLLFSCTAQESTPFSVEKISATAPCGQLSEREKAIVEEALSQEYHYFGRGGQSHVFFSADGQFVLKFLKPKFSKNKGKAALQKNKVLSAFQLCSENFAQETGVLYAHLKHTPLPRTARLFGPEGAPLPLDLEEHLFLLQKRAILAYDQIDAWVSEGREDLAKEGIESLLVLHVDLFKKGFRNRDANFKSNCGFIEGQPILFDIGRVVYSEEIKNQENHKKEIARITPRFRQWLATHHEELLEHFDQIVARFL